MWEVCLDGVFQTCSTWFVSYVAGRAQDISRLSYFTIKGLPHLRSGNLLVAHGSSMTQLRCASHGTSSDENLLEGACLAVKHGELFDASTCCPAASWPALLAPKDYKPVGEVVPVGELEAYCVGKRGPRAVVVIQEIYGWDGRLKGICDALAEQGYFVVMPDFHRGKTAHGMSDVEKMALLAEMPFEGQLMSDVRAVLAWLQDLAVERVAGVGFCWGGWVLCKASSFGLPFQCGASAHPSTKIERSVFKGDEEALAHAVKMPLLLLPAGNDPPELKEAGAVAQALQQGRSVEFPEMKHGWVTRGDLGDPAVQRDAELAMDLIMDHLRLHF